jgi:hypothetical protein
MREDIVGMLKNAVERGGRPDKVAESLINSGYNALEVQQALAHITEGTLSSLNAPVTPPTQVNSIISTGNRSMYSQMPQAVSDLQPQISPNKISGKIKIIILVFILLFLFGGLIATIIFKEDILKIFE